MTVANSRLWVTLSIHVPNITQWWSDKTPRGWWWCSQLAEKNGGNSTQKTKQN